MAKQAEESTSVLRGSFKSTAFRLIFISAFVCFVQAAAQPQTFQLLHTFTNAGDGRAPLTSMTMDRGGNLYGTTSTTLFKMTHTASGWVLNTIYTFHGPDGNGPLSPLIFGPDGALYGTTAEGGVSADGVVFRVKPPASFCHAVSCPWTENVLHNFGGGTDSSFPRGHIIFDSSGNLYGTNYGIYIASKNEPPLGSGGGVAWELVHTGNSWQINVLHVFMGGSDGAHPAGGVTFDRQGNLYGTTQFEGANNLGIVFQLTHSGSGWTENTIYNFQGQEGAPEAGLISDAAGNMYGATLVGAYAFELMPTGGGWNFSNLYQITTGGPQSDLTLDSQGNLYGTNVSGGNHRKGNVFKLTNSNGIWTYTDLYDFTGGNDGDGSNGIGGVIVDSTGNIYGTTPGGGANGFGTVWMITP
jgi:uncharacterized repeat protein (TIGR03803 family)